MNVGDKVRIVEAGQRSKSAYRGRVGTIVRVDRDDTWPYLVQLDGEYLMPFWCKKVEAA